MEKKQKNYYVPLVRTYFVKEKVLKYEEKELNQASKIAGLAKLLLEHADREYLMVLSLDNKCHPLAMEIITIGTVDQTLVNVRDIMKHALLSNASGIVLIHNHTSGNTKPSQEDMQTTEKIMKASKLLGITLHDHIIVGDDYYSFREKGDFK